MEILGDIIGLAARILRQLHHDIAPCPARRDGIDTDAFRREIHGLVAGELQDRRLGNGIDPTPGLGDARRNGAEIDDGPLVLRQMRPGRLHQSNGAENVDVEGLEPVGAGGFCAVVEIGASDVDKKIQSSSRLHGLMDERLDFIVTGDVGLDETNILAAALRCRLAGFAVNIGDDNRNAIVSQYLGNAFADQRCAAGHNRSLAFQSTHGHSPSCFGFSKKMRSGDCCGRQKCAVAVDQRIIPPFGKMRGGDLTDQDQMRAELFDLRQLAFEGHRRIVQHRRACFDRSPAAGGKTLLPHKTGPAGKDLGDVLLVERQHVDGKDAGAFDHGGNRAVAVYAGDQRWRLGRERTNSSRSQPAALTPAVDGGNNRDTASQLAHAGAEFLATHFFVPLRMDFRSISCLKFRRCSDEVERSAIQIARGDIQIRQQAV
ncbi:hypothetical protein RHSP_03455 [Rhizobium freirei PRF 81]|uniref:Uncharacterized protein n=1 Tax=Rhizobium freirei PRF 81 TaxID=363754 RepID=N6V3X1_9HYPH|nr:hypothetical protein RHSP_03455 [Rhizobium freirei PRF 81]